MAFNSKYGPYSKGPVSAFTVNTGQPQGGPATPQPYRPPTTQAVGGFGGQAAQFGQDSAVQRLAAHLASGTNPSSGLPGSIPDPVTSGPGPTGADTPGITPGTVQQPDPIPPGLASQTAADAAAGMGAFQKNATLQQPKNPAGLPNPYAAPQWVLNNADGSPGNIDDVVGYTGPQPGTGLFTGLQGEPGTPTYMGLGWFPGQPPAYGAAPGAAALLAQQLARG